jgi:acetyltransferase-like isoleucine patch superfamily enzyme
VYPLSALLSRVLKKLRGSAIVRSEIHPTAKVESGSLVIDSEFARHSFCGYDCTIVNTEVGPFCSIASRVSIGGARHPMEFVSMSPVFLSHRDSVRTKLARHVYAHVPRTTIGADVWIGEGVFVRSGVTIGTGAVVGMGSVVTKDVPPYAVVAGNPATLKRMRFRDAVVDAMLKFRWWEKSDDELRAIAADFTDPELVLRKAGLL